METLLGNPTTGNILTLVGIILTVIVSVAIVVYQRTRKELSYAIVSTPVLQMHAKVKDQLEITFKGIPVNDPHLVLITLRNSGNVPILPNDYAAPLVFRFRDRAEILSAGILETSPAHMHNRIPLKAQGKELVLEPFLFNGKYSATIQALVSNYEGVEPSYLIAGIHTLKMLKTPGRRTMPRQLLHVLLYALYVVSILILFSYAGAMLFPGISTQPPEAVFSGFFLLLLPAALLTLVGRFLQTGIRSTKNRLEAFVLTYLGSLILGGVLALLSLLTVSGSAHLNLAWLGSTWFGPWFTIFLVGALLMFPLAV